MSESKKQVIFIILVAVVLIQTGAHLGQAFINYPAWRFIGSDGFVSYHQRIELGAIFGLLIPRVVEIVLGLFVLRYRPIHVPRTALAIGIALAVGGLLSTALVQRPIHVQLAVLGNTPDLLSALQRTDLYRQAMEVGRSAIYVFLLMRLVHGLNRFGPHETSVTPVA